MEGLGHIDWKKGHIKPRIGHIKQDSVLVKSKIGHKARSRAPRPKKGYINPRKWRIKQNSGHNHHPTKSHLISKKSITQTNNKINQLKKPTLSERRSHSI